MFRLSSDIGSYSFRNTASLLLSANNHGDKYGKYQYQYIVVGSGAGGATVARELSKAGKSVLVVEKGKTEEKTGTFLDFPALLRCQQAHQNTKKSKEGAILWLAYMAGGSRWFQWQIKLWMNI